MIYSAHPETLLPTQHLIPAISPAIFSLEVAPMAKKKEN